MLNYAGLNLLTSFAIFAVQTQNRGKIPSYFWIIRRKCHPLKLSEDDSLTSKSLTMIWEIMLKNRVNFIASSGFGLL